MNTEKAVDPLVKAALAHFCFVTLHPFEDGNGRIARAVADMLLFRAQRSPNGVEEPQRFYSMSAQIRTCLLYTSDAADERSSVDLGGRRIIQKKRKKIASMPCTLYSYTTSNTVYSNSELK